MTNVLFTSDVKVMQDALRGVSPVDYEVSPDQSEHGARLASFGYPLVPRNLIDSEPVYNRMLSAQGASVISGAGHATNAVRFYSPPVSRVVASHELRTAFAQVQAMQRSVPSKLQGAGSSLQVASDGTVDVSEIEAFCLHTRSMCQWLYDTLGAVEKRLASVEKANKSAARSSSASDKRYPADKRYSSDKRPPADKRKVFSSHRSSSHSRGGGEGEGTNE